MKAEEDATRVVPAMLAVRRSLESINPKQMRGSTDRGRGRGRLGNLKSNFRDFVLSSIQKMSLALLEFRGEWDEHIPRAMGVRKGRALAASLAGLAAVFACVAVASLASHHVSCLADRTDEKCYTGFGLGEMVGGGVRESGWGAREAEASGVLGFACSSLHLGGEHVLHSRV